MMEPTALSAPVFMRQAWLAAPRPYFLSAEIRVGWTPSHLVVLANLPDCDIFTLATGPNQRMWELGDVFEIFLQAENRSDYIELHVTPANFRLQLHIECPGGSRAHLDDGAFASRVEIDPLNELWRVCAEIPAKIVSGRDTIMPGEVWRFSFSRYDASRDGSAPVLSSTSPHQEVNFHRTNEWGRLKFQPAPDC